MESSKKGKIAVVTGASSGIGAAIVVALADKGYEVVGLARRVDRITALASKTKGSIHARACDVSDENQILETFKWINDTFGGVDVLINNAGLYEYGGVLSGTHEHWKATYDVNVLAVTLCTKEAVKTMRERGDNGYIININSLACHMDIIAHAGMYMSSKHALKAVSKSISNDLKDLNSKIKVTNLSPGTIYTEMYLKIRDQLYGVKSDGIVKENTIPEYSLISEDIADGVLYILNTPDRVQIAEIIIQPVGQQTIRTTEMNRNE